MTADGKDTCAKPDSLRFGAIAMLSSSVKAAGQSPTGRRTMASGMRGPSAARAKTNSVSPAATRAASAGLRLTSPPIAPATLAGAGDAGDAAALSAASSFVACTMLPCTERAMSESGGTSASTRSQ